MSADLENRFTYHAPVAGDLEFYEHGRKMAKDLAHFFLLNVPESRELSLALTKIEEAVMWANAGRARIAPDGTRK